MKPTRHSDCVNKIRLAISDLGGISVAFTVGNFRQIDSDRVVKIGMPGVSDVLACYHGQFIAVEIKVDRDRQRPEQRRFQAAIEENGGLYIIARFNDSEDGVETLKEKLK